MLRELKFSIANHTFWYTYEIPFELPLDSPINNFRIGDYTIMIQKTALGLTRHYWNIANGRQILRHQLGHTMIVKKSSLCIRTKQ